MPINSHPGFHERCCDAAESIYEELEAAWEASQGAYCEPSSITGKMIAGKTIEVSFADGSRYRLTVEELTAPTEGE